MSNSSSRRPSFPPRKYPSTYRPILRDRHARGQHDTLIHPGLPGWVTFHQQFTHIIQIWAMRLVKRWPEVADIEFAVEDCPPSPPAPWEPHNYNYARLFRPDRRLGLAPRLVVYRLPVQRHPHPQWAHVEFVAAVALRLSDILPATSREIEDVLWDPEPSRPKP